MNWSSKPSTDGVHNLSMHLLNAIMSNHRLFYYLLLVSTLVSCSDQKHAYKLATSSENSSYHKAGEAIAQVLKEESNFDIEVLSGSNMSTGGNCELLLQRKADFAFAQNDTDVRHILEKYKGVSDVKIRTVVPVYPEIIFIMYPDSLNPASIQELIIGKKIGLGPRQSGTAQFMVELFRQFGIDSTQYTPVFCSFDDNHLDNKLIDVSCAVTGFNNKRIERILTEQNGVIFGLDDVDLAFRGSAVDGFCLKYPRPDLLLFLKV